MSLNGERRVTGVFLKPDGKPVGLVVDPDPAVLAPYRFPHPHFDFITASDRESAMAAFLRDKPDIVIISDDSGLIPADFRQENPFKPVIMTTSVKDTDRNDVFGEKFMEGLEADSLLRKPILSRVLEAHAMGILRQTLGSQELVENRVVYGDLDMDCLRMVLKVRGRLVDLGVKEWGVLEFLIRHPSTVSSRDQILDGVWGSQSWIQGNTVDVHVAWLRRAIEENPRKPKYVKTARGFGYKIYDLAESV